jgi:hypothetical protein
VHIWSNDKWVPAISKIENGRKESAGNKKDGQPKLGAKKFKYETNPAYAEVWKDNTAGPFKGKFQCDASDRRKVILPNNAEVETTLLQSGEFDVVAACIFSFRNIWEFGFALNTELPKTTHYGENSQHLIASHVDIEYPLIDDGIFKSCPISLFEALIKGL